MSNPNHIEGHTQPDGDGHQVTYERNGSRKVHHFPTIDSETELPPHGAGSFHDPDHHQKLMDRIENFLTERCKKNPR